MVNSVGSKIRTVVENFVVSSLKPIGKADVVLIVRNSEEVALSSPGPIAVKKAVLTGGNLRKADLPYVYFKIEMTLDPQDSGSNASKGSLEVTLGIGLREGLSCWALQRAVVNQSLFLEY